MDERAEGLILRMRPLTESSWIVQWLTPQFGRIATVAKGARRPKSPFLGKLDLFYLAEFSFRRQRRGDLHTLCEVDLKQTNTHLREQVGFLYQAAYFAHLIEQATETETPLPGFFKLLVRTIESLPSFRSPALALFAFEIGALKELGLEPDWDRLEVDPGTRAVLVRLAAGLEGGIDHLQVTPTQRTRIEKFLHGYLIYHLGGLAPGRSDALGFAGIQETGRGSAPEAPRPDTPR